MIQKGADVNAKDNDQKTPLHHTISTPNGRRSSSSVEMAELLIQNGADVNATDKCNCTPLHVAADDQPKMVELLLKHGARKDMKDASNRTPFQWAHVIRSDNTNFYNQTPLERAQNRFNCEVIDLLQEN